MMTYAVLLSLALLLLLLIQGRFGVAPLFVSWAIGYYFFGLVDQKSLLNSYANPALITLVLLLTVSIVLERIPMIDGIAHRCLKGSPRFALLRLTGITAFLSAFLNNTAVVGTLINPLMRQPHQPPSRLLLPLSYAAIVGGVTTLVGTSTNLVVNSFAVDAGLPPLGMFQLSWVGIPLALGCLLVMAFTYQLLPVHPATVIQSEQHYFLEARVLSGSPLAGKTIEANRLRNLDGLFLLEIERYGQLISPVGPHEVLYEQDRLIFTGAMENVSALQRFAGLEIFGDRVDDLLQSNLVEAVVLPGSELVHQTMRELDFRAMFDAGVVAIRRGNQRLSGQLGRIKLNAGDGLLLAVGPDFAQQRNLANHLLLVNSTISEAKLSPRQSMFALLGFAAVVVLSTLDVLPLFNGLLCLLGFFVMCGWLSFAEVKRRFPFELLLVIGSALVIAQVMEKSGVAALVVEGIQGGVAGQGVWWALVGVYLATLMMTELVTNNAAAALAFPIALAAARAFDVDPTPFVLVVCYGASAGFLIPFGYQTHLMVYSPGRYRMVDFIKFGLPVSVVYSVITLVLVPYFFPFN